MFSDKFNFWLFSNKFLIWYNVIHYNSHFDELINKDVKTTWKIVQISLRQNSTFINIHVS